MASMSHMGSGFVGELRSYEGAANRSYWKMGSPSWPKVPSAKGTGLLPSLI